MVLSPGSSAMPSIVTSAAASSSGAAAGPPVPPPHEARTRANATEAAVTKALGWIARGVIGSDSGADPYLDGISRNLEVIDTLTRMCGDARIVELLRIAG